MSFATDAALRYELANRTTLDWLLVRPPLEGVFLDTKINPITGVDYTRKDGLRGPGWIYGWIQGRGLEALATFSRHYRKSAPTFSRHLEDRMRPLYARLARMVRRHGHAYFLYNTDLQPMRPALVGATNQATPADIWTYSDAFVAKGLVAAAALIATKDLPEHLAYLSEVIEAIEAGRFQMDETVELGEDALAAQPDDFGPRMILLGAAGMLRRAELEVEDWACEFIRYVLARHLDPKGFLRNVPGEDAINAGHGIEFVGFAFDRYGKHIEPALRDQLAGVLTASLELAFRGPGIALSVSAESGVPLSPYYPWWPLPETIRACALALATGADPALEEWWRRADSAFFSRYWRKGRGYAYQTRDPDGPVNYVPATPDLDPGYHTGLSLLAAATA